jgi:hypothetical protein
MILGRSGAGLVGRSERRIISRGAVDSSSVLHKLKYQMSPVEICGQHTAQAYFITISTFGRTRKEISCLWRLYPSAHRLSLLERLPDCILLDNTNFEILAH